MAKGSGGTKNARVRTDTREAQDIERLMNSDNDWIQSGMNRLDLDINRGDDLSDMKNLSMNEKRVVVAYLSHSYQTVNDTLRGKESDRDALLLADKIDSALSKLPSYRGETIRSVGFDGRKADAEAKAFASTFKPGETVKFNEFISTGTNVSKIKSKFKSDANIIFTIKSKTGKDLRRYNSEEKEVLFRKGTSFRVISKRGSNIRLEEV